MKKTILFLLFIFTTFHAHSQTADSLAAVLNSTKNEVQGKELYRELFKYYEYDKPDSAIYYLKMSTAEFNRSGYKDGIATMVNLDALIDADQGRRNIAREKDNKALKMYESTVNKAGMTKDQQSGLFQPFSSSTRGTADEKGSGIGLMLCKEFIEENGGKIWLDSMPGEGTTFFFSLKAMTPSTINKVTAVTA
jgi:light-regulated signal transduction histidine kinase (bacteriophytochrome)